MDNLLVDLDKVLDDFEAEEKEAISAPGQELSPSGYSEYLRQHEDQPWKILSEAPVTEPAVYHKDELQTKPGVGSLMYDLPYEPAEKFDLSEADFAPSPPQVDKNINGSVIYEFEKEVPTSLSPAHQVYNLEVSEKNFQNQSLPGLKSMDKNINDVNHHAELKYPVQAADNSPDAIQNTVFQLNGHVPVSPQCSPTSSLTETQVQAAGQLPVSLTVSPSVAGDTDMDKYPVQCNTPQTPSDHPNVNPLDTQIKQTQGNQADVERQCPAVSSIVNGTAGQDSYVNESSQLPKQQNIPVTTIPDAASQTPVSVEPSELNGIMQSNDGYSSLPVVGQVTRAVVPQQQTSLPATLGQPTYSSSQGADSFNNSVCGLGEDHRSHDLPMTGAPTAPVAQTSSSQPMFTDHGVGVVSEATHSSPQHATAAIETASQDVVTTKPVIGFGSVDMEVNEDELVDYLDDKVSEPSLQSALEADIVASVQTADTNSGTDQLSSFDHMISHVPKQDQDNLAASRSVVDRTDQGDVTIRTANVATQAVTNPVELVALPSDQPGQLYDTADLEILKVLPPDNVGLDSRSPDHHESEESVTLVPVSYPGGVESGAIQENLADPGARPKETPNRVHRPNSLMGLSVVDLNSESPFTARPAVEPIVSEQIAGEMCEDGSHSSDYSPKIQAMDASVEKPDQKEQELRQRMEHSALESAPQVSSPAVPDQSTEERREPADSMVTDDGTTVSQEDSMEAEDVVDTEGVTLRQNLRGDGQEPSAGRPHSWSPVSSGQPVPPKQKRPTSLNLPPRPEYSNGSDRSPPEYQSSPEEAGASGQTVAVAEETETSTGGGETPPGEEFIGADGTLAEASLPPAYSTTSLGKVAPKWVPDGEAAACMACEARFTFTKRRHHCRACGKVFCSSCCNMKSKLIYMESKEARVCSSCHQEIAAAELWSEAWSPGRSPHPTNPSDYCSIIPPSQQANCPAPPPSVLVPVGVLKREGTSKRGEPKQVMFSDGIRPGGDLTELDGSSEITRMPPRRSGRVQKRVERSSQGGQHSPRSRRLRTVENRGGKSLIPEDGLPPVMVPSDSGLSMQHNPNQETMMQQIKDESAAPVTFAINGNLHVLVKILSLDCCVNRVVWCFTTRGLVTVGQEELVIALEFIPEEEAIPLDVFYHLSSVYEEACKGNTVTELGHTIFNQTFLGSRDHGGFLYIRATFQCVQKLVLPSPPFLFGILLQKWETPWAKVFPIRLLLRLGAEYRYYPCPLIGVRNRKPVFYEIGHTIMNLLADFRNYQYMLPQIRGITIHMEDKKTKINFPRNRYDELMKVVSNSNEHVMAMGANFSPEADSHLVCIQNDDGNYQTQAINIQNKPRKVTGASFVVFNGALKTSSGLSAKSSIVEDGLMVQITPDSMLALKQAMKDMQEYSIVCGSVTAPRPDETVLVQWVDDDKNVNIGVKSPIDKMPMDGVESVHIHNFTDYVGEKSIIRWTEVFFIQNEDNGSAKWDPVDLSRLGETLATACCIALSPHLEKLKEASLTKIGLRVTIELENVGYEAGAKGERLPDNYMNDLDNELIPVIHRATQESHDGPIVLELLFQILDI